VPLASVLTATFGLALNLVPVFAFIMLNGIFPRLSWLWAIPLLAALVLFAFGLSLMLSALYVRFRDIEPIWDVVLQIMFYATPIFYPIEMLVYINGGEHPVLGRILMASPFACIIQEMRHVVIDPGYLTASQAIGLTWRMAIPVGIFVGVLVVGYRMFSKEAPRIAEDL
jgi:ABC-2 type transport system permease protein